MNESYQKKLTRLYVQEKLALQHVVPLTEDQCHHLLTVLRKKEGDHVLLFNGSEGEWLAVLKQESKKKFLAVCLKKSRSQGSQHPLGLAFSPLKKHRQDFLIEKATELGVTHLMPVDMRYTNLLSFNQAKVLKQCIEAAEQCERLLVPEVEPLIKLALWLNSWAGDRSLYVALERASAEPSLVDVLEENKEAAFLVGPEGGFSEEEIALLKEYSFVKFFSLGPLILRAETAAILCVGLYNQLKGNKNA